MNNYIINSLGGLSQFVVTQNNLVLGEFATLALAMAYVASVMKVGQSVTYTSQLAGTPV